MKKALGQFWLCALFLLPAVLTGGCTTALWDKNTFAEYHRPATPSNLRLFYSEKRKDILVQYDEQGRNNRPGRPRCYWLESNTPRVNEEKQPHFVSAGSAQGLTPLPIHDAPLNPPPADLNGLYAVARRDELLFMLYSGKGQPDPYTLPIYRGGSQKVKQVLLTPFAVAVDATIVGAVIGYYSAPSILSGLNR